MANYGVVINSTFKPFSYQELAMPLDRMEAYHEKLAEEYDKMSSQADVLEAMGANERDRKSGAYSRYKAYSDALREEADDLYRNGLNFNSRQRLSDLRRRYSQEIVPIQNAWTKREQESAEQMKARLNNPHIMFTRDAQSTSLEDYIKNPTGGYGVINGANINAQMSAMAKNLADRVYSGGKREDIDDFTYNYIRDYGLDANLIRNWQNNPTLSKMFKQVMEANGITPEMLANSANGQDILNRSMGYAEMGMWDAMGKSEVQQMQDFKAREDYKFAQQKELEELRHRNALKEKGVSEGGSAIYGKPKFDVRNVRTTAETEQLEKDKSAWDDYRQYFYKNERGNWVMNKKGRDLYNNAVKYSNTESTTPQRKLVDPFPEISNAERAIRANNNPSQPAADRNAKRFKEFVDRLNLQGMAVGRIGKNQTANLDALNKRISNVLDVNTALEYTRTIGSTNYDNVISALNKNAVEGEIPVYERVGKKGAYKYIKKGRDKSKVSELTSGDIKSAQIIYGNHGDFLEVKLKDGSTILQPFEALSNTYSTIVEGNRGTIQKYREAKAQGLKAVEVAPGQVVSIDDLINEELNSYGNNLLSALSVDEIEPEKTKPDYYGTR